MDELVTDLLRVFKIVAAVGFVATGGLMTAFSWKLFKKIVTEQLHKDFGKYRLIFLPIAAVIAFAWIYMYYILF